ncbi:MAG: rubredoxin [Pseudanabaenaceae cyanobacterium bins.39]|nr:rubredoxin [Pseudanabaenaceae cyanobacterium bins.39]
MEPELTNTENLSTEINTDISIATGTTPEIASAEVEEELHRYECGVCGYVYEPAVGDAKRNIPAGTAFESLATDWRCPVCNTKKKAFADIGVAAKPSGFTENLGYGFGVNVLTPAQKNLLIFGSLALAVIFFISLYALD